MKKNKLYIILILIILLLILLLTIFTFIRNNNKTNQTSIISNNSKEDTEQLNYKFFERGFIPYDDMTYFNNIYYKKISSLEEYDDFKTKASSLPECETNFEENFILVIMTENVSTEYFVPIKVYDENDTLYIGLIKDINTNPNSNAIVLELSKNLEKNNIEPYKTIDEDIPYENYTPIKELPQEYSSEDAKNDNCYVTQDGGIVLNQKLVEDFLNNYNNSKDAFIRKVRFSGDTEFITDIYYSSTENKFLVCIDSTRVRENSTYNYYEYSNLDKMTLNVGKDGSTDFYTLTNSLEEDLTIFNL